MVSEDFMEAPFLSWSEKWKQLSYDDAGNVCVSVSVLWCKEQPGKRRREKWYHPLCEKTGTAPYDPGIQIYKRGDRGSGWTCAGRDRPDQA